MVGHKGNHMAREVGLLNARKVETLSKPGRHADGGNLYISISPNGGRRWGVFLQVQGHSERKGLGSAAKGQVSLAEARKAASDARSLIAEALTPLAQRKLANRPKEPSPFLELLRMTILPHTAPSFGMNSISPSGKRPSKPTVSQFAQCT